MPSDSDQIPDDHVSRRRRPGDQDPRPRVETNHVARGRGQAADRVRTRPVQKDTHLVPWTRPEPRRVKAQPVSRDHVARDLHMDPGSRDESTDHEPLNRAPPRARSQDDPIAQEANPTDLDDRRPRVSRLGRRIQNDRPRDRRQIALQDNRIRRGPRDREPDRQRTGPRLRVRVQNRLTKRAHPTVRRRRHRERRRHEDRRCQR